MTTNPLALRRTEAANTGYTQSGYRYGTQEWADWRNSTMARSDIEWAIDGKGGAYLRDRASWTASRTAELKRANETERARWKWRQANPEKALGHIAAD